MSVFIAYQNTELDGILTEQATFTADTRETFSPPMYGLRSDYEDLFAYEAAKKELEAHLAEAKAAQDTTQINTLEGQQYEAQTLLRSISAELEIAAKAEERDEAKIISLKKQKAEAKVALTTIEAQLAELRSPVTEIEEEIKALVKPDKVLPFVLIDRIEEYEGRAKIVNNKVLFDTDIDVAEMKALEKQYTVQVQKMLDEAAYALGYTGENEQVAGACNSVCTYVDTGVAKFDAEGKQFRKWRSAIWARGYELLAEVKAGTRLVPTPEELSNLLPKLEDFAETEVEAATE